MESDEYLWKSKLKEYRDAIKKAKGDKWKEYVEEADERSIWKVKKYLDTTPITTYIPTLLRSATTTNEKAEILKANFFPPPPPTEITGIEGTIYPAPLETATTISMSQLQRAIEKLMPKKAPGPDEIPNLILKKCFGTLQHHLLLLA